MTTGPEPRARPLDCGGSGPGRVLGRLGRLARRPRRAAAARHLGVGHLQLASALRTCAASSPSSSSTSGSSARAPSIATRSWSGSRSSSVPGARPALRPPRLISDTTVWTSDVLDAHALDLRLVGGAHLLLGGLLRRLRAHAVAQHTSPGSRGPSQRRPRAATRPPSSARRWRWAELRSGSADVEAVLARGPARSTSSSALERRARGLLLERGRGRSARRPSRGGSPARRSPRRGGAGGRPPARPRRRRARPAGRTR